MVLSGHRVYKRAANHILSVVYVAAVCVITVLLYCVRIWKERRYLEVFKAAALPSC